MKKSWNKLFSTVMAGMMVAGLMACGQSQAPATTAAATTAAAETTAAAAETTAAAAETTAAAAETTAAAAAETTAAAADAGKVDFPTETITLICPYSAGGATDVGARFMATALSKQLGVNVVVENQTGSGGWIAWNDLITGNYSDGYRICLLNHAYALGKYDPENPRDYGLDDIQLVGSQCVDYNVMAIRMDETRFTDLNSFIEYAKANPVLIATQFTNLTDGDATNAMLLNNKFGTDITLVPVDGSADSKSMFLAGDTDVYFCNVSDAVKENGETMKVVCIFANERSELLPDVPTMEEITGEKYESFSCRGFCYPKSVDPAIVQIMTDALKAASQDEQYIKNMKEFGVELIDMDGDEFKALLESQLDTRLDIWNLK